MTRFFFLTVILLLAFPGKPEAQATDGKGLTIVFYNTENLFDTIDDPTKEDQDFLPGAQVSWTAERCDRKLEHTARAIAAIDSNDLPAIAGLAEVENFDILKRLVRTRPLDRGGYEALLEEGPDPRGIDVAVIYRPARVKYLAHAAFPSAQSFRTRNILYAKFLAANRDTLHLFVNHWKSRSGGQKETEKQRIENARMLKAHTDSLFRLDPAARIIIMGDLNDEPSDTSIARVLGAREVPAKSYQTAGLYNVMYPRFRNGEGTLFYKDWDLFDQFIVSGSLLKKSRGRAASIADPYAWIFKAPWLLYKNRSGEYVPNRTAGSRDYFGGYSDHLPVYLRLNLR